MEPALVVVLVVLLSIVSLVDSVLVSLFDSVLISLLDSVLISLLDSVLIALVLGALVSDLPTVVSLGVVPVMPVVFAEGARHGRAGFTGLPSRFIKLQTNSNAPMRWPVVSHTLLVCMNRWPSKLTRANGTSPISLDATEGKTKTTVHKQRNT